MITPTLVSYIWLATLNVGSLFLKQKSLLRLLLAGCIGFAFSQGIVDILGLLGIGLYWIFCEGYGRRLSQKSGFGILSLTVLIVIALAFANHLVPGFHNVQVFRGVSLSSSSMPFTMYLNFDKAVGALILCITSGVIHQHAKLFTKKIFSETIKISLMCIGTLIPLAIISGCVKFEPKFPEIFGVWAFNNLMLVCFAEEVIFRGIIQTHLTKLTNSWNLPVFIPIFLTSLLFGTLLLGHLYGGPVYMTFAIISGMFYGYAYHKTQRLEAAILVHFLLNLCHFLLFSYPMAVR